MLKLAHAIIAPVLPLVPLVLTKLAPVLPLVPLLLTKLAAAAQPLPQAPVPYGVAARSWPESLGNHRARVQVEQAAEAVWVHLPWRRRDLAPERKNFMVVDLATGKTIGALCEETFRDFPPGLKLVARNTRMTKFTITRAVIEHPDRELAQWVLASFTAANQA